VVLYYAIRLAAGLTRWAPLKLSYLVAGVCGAAAFYAWPGGRRRSIANMRHIVRDERKARQLARRSFANYAIYLVDFFRSTAVTAEEVRARFAFEGWPVLQAGRTGNGLVLVTMHFGNWDLGAAAVAEQGMPISVIADTFSHPRVNELVLGARK